jgi:hypothetical protein
MRFTKTIFLLLKILWTFIRGMIMCLQLGLSFLGISAEAPISPTLTFYDGIFALILLLLVMTQHFSESTKFRKFVVVSLLADLALLLLLFISVVHWPLVMTLMLVLMVLQGLIIYRLRKVTG